MKHLNMTDVTRARIGKWMMSAQSITKTPVWTEKRMAIDVGEHTFLITNGQIFQCAHCGHYDPEWSAVEVLAFFKETMGVEPYEIEVTCSLPVARKNDE